LVIVDIDIITLLHGERECVMVNVTECWWTARAGECRFRPGALHCAH